MFENAVIPPRKTATPQIEMRPIGSITPYEKNAKKHPLKQIVDIAKSIKKFGFNQPIAVDKNGVIIAGHGRHLAAQQLELKEVPVIVIDISEADAKAYRLADNKLNESEWDNALVIEELKGLHIAGYEDLDLTGFSSDMYTESSKDDDKVPEVPEEPTTQPGQIYKLGNHRVMCGSSTNPEDVAALMQGELAEMVWTDPPYNENVERQENGRGYGREEGTAIKNDKMSALNFHQFMLDFYTQTKNIMHNGCPIYVAHADMQTFTFRETLQQAGIELKQCIIWVKNSLVLGRQDYQWQHEPILYGWKAGAAHRWYGMYDKTTVIDEEVDVDEMKKDDLKALVKQMREERNTTVVRHDRPTKSKEHPTMKPVGLIMKFLYNSSRQGDLVYDGFGGSGSTLIACEKTKRRCYTMELDPKYVSVIVKRWEEYTGEKAELILTKHDKIGQYAEHREAETTGDTTPYPGL